MNHEGIATILATGGNAMVSFLLMWETKLLGVGARSM